MTVTARREDVPLHEDVRWLAGALGRVIQRLEGKEAFEIVERLRSGSRARRHGERGAPSLDDLLREVDALSVTQCAVVARAFTLFFLLINTAEQTHRVRRRNAYLGKGVTDAQPASARWTMRELRTLGAAPDAIEKAMVALDIRPVLTAHPTESTRSTLLGLQARVADGLLSRESAPADTGRLIEQALEGEVELLWLTSEVRQDRPSVLDEVRSLSRKNSAGRQIRSGSRCHFDSERGWEGTATEILTSRPKLQSRQRGGRVT